MERLLFASDYQEGAHPEIIKRLAETNFEKSAGYGLDSFSDAARKHIKDAPRVLNVPILYKEPSFFKRFSNSADGRFFSESFKRI